MQTDRGFLVHRAFGDWDSTLKVFRYFFLQCTTSGYSGRDGAGEGPAELLSPLASRWTRSFGGRDSGQCVAHAPLDLGLIFSICRSNCAGMQPAALLAWSCPRQPHGA